MKDESKEYTLSFATDKNTFISIRDLALESMTTKSQLCDIFAKHGILNHELVLNTTKRYFSLEILTLKSAKIVENMRNYDEFYEFKRNISEICMNLSGNLGPIFESGVAGCGIKDLTDLLREIQTKEPVLFKDCIPIVKHNLNKAQRDIVLDTL